MLDVRLRPRRLEQDEMPLQVTAAVSERVDQRIADAGLGRKVDDAVDLRMALEQFRDRLAIGDVRLEEREVRFLRQLREAGLLERNIVVVVQIVDSDHRVAASQKRQRRMIPR